MPDTAHQRVGTRNPRTSALFELGPVDPHAPWIDYLRFGFDHDDVPDLLQLICDKSLRSGEAETNETWVPIHAWRALGQLRSAKAVSTLIVLFDHAPYFDWALKDLARVLGMIGEPAIDLLSVYIREHRRPDFARAIAYDALVEVVQYHPGCRERVVDSFRQYLARPDRTCKSLNGYLVGRLLDLGTVELVADIRRLFESGCVDSTCAGGLRSVELELNLRARDSAHIYGSPGPRGYVERESVVGEESYATMDGFLDRYGNEQSIEDCSALDGFFAALVCAPALIRSARWMPALWGGKERLPAWESGDEAEQFEKLATSLNGFVMTSIDKGRYQPLFHELRGEGLHGIFVGEWCTGFLQGLQLWGLLGHADRSMVDKLLAPVRLFGTEKGRRKLETMDSNAVTAQQARIESAVHELFRYFREQRQKLYDDFVKDAVEADRDRPCPCGSGRLYKNCCLHS